MNIHAELSLSAGQVKELLDKLGKTLEQKKAKKELLIRDKQECEDAIASLDVANYEKAGVLIKQLAESQKVNACNELSSLGTMALQYSLGPKYKMQIEMKGTVKRSTADVWVIKDGKEDEKEDPFEDNGGGVSDIIGCSMRIVILDNYNTPVIDGPVIFDEPFKMVSKEYIPMLIDFVSNVSKDFGRQIIQVTHDEYLSAIADSNIYVSLDEENHSVIEVRKNGEAVSNE